MSRSWVVCLLSTLALGLSIFGFAQWGDGIFILCSIASVMGFGGGVAMLKEDRSEEKRHIKGN